MGKIAREPNRTGPARALPSPSPPRPHHRCVTIPSSAEAARPPARPPSDVLVGNGVRQPKAANGDNDESPPNPELPRVQALPTERQRTKSILGRIVPQRQSATCRQKKQTTTNSHCADLWQCLFLVPTITTKNHGIFYFSFNYLLRLLRTHSTVKRHPAKVLTSRSASYCNALHPQRRR